MARRKKLSDMARWRMAKSYHAGTRVSELAAEWGVSMSYVINVAKAWETEQKLRKLAILEKQQRQQIKPPPMTTPMPPVRRVIERKGQRILVVEMPVSYGGHCGSADRRTTMVSLQYVSMQEAG